jgi:hypothetical protein
MTQNWIQWFIGFLDAEGNFQVTLRIRKNLNGNIISYGVLVALHIGLAARDLSLLQEIQLILGGIGKIYIYEDKVQLAITKKADILALLNQIFPEHSLLTVHQYQRYYVLHKVLTEKIVSVNDPEDFKLLKGTIVEAPNPFLPVHTHVNSWIVGFINGEGSFIVNTKRNVFTFYLEHTDEPALQLVATTLGLRIKVISRTQRPGRKPTWCITTNSRHDISKVVAFLDSNESLKGYKLMQYTDWKVKWLVKVA